MSLLRTAFVSRPVEQEKKMGKFLGLEMEIDDAGWHWCLVFPMLNKKNAAAFNEPMPHAIETARKIFKDRTWEIMGAKHLFRTSMTRFEWHEAIRSKFIEILCGKRNGMKLGKLYSIDGDEVFLLIELKNMEAKRSIADRLETRVPVTPEAYPEEHKMSSPGHRLREPMVESELEDEFSSAINTAKDGYMTLPSTSLPSVRSEYSQAASIASSNNGGPIRHSCPTTSFGSGSFHQDSEDERRSKETACCYHAPAEFCPLHRRYEEEFHERFQPFREVDCIRMIRGRIREFFSLVQLHDQGVVLQMFPVHRYSQMQKFWYRGFSDFTKLRPLPMGQHIDEARNYFGEEVAFFFHWVTFYTRFLIFPAVTGIALVLVEHFEEGSHEMTMYSNVIFCCCMVFWSALFIGKYQQRAGIKNCMWGMSHLSDFAEARRDFKPALRGTNWESFQFAMHWVLAILFMCETFVVVWYLNRFRQRAIALGEGETLHGLTGPVAMKVAKYGLTLNIRVVDLVWSTLSPALSRWENWRTDNLVKNHSVHKLFMVKFIVYYYPFFNIAFLKEHFVGCSDPELFCLPELEESLFVYFFSDIAISVVFITLPMLTTYWAVLTEIWGEKAQRDEVDRQSRKQLSGSDSDPSEVHLHGLAPSHYTYVQAQSKCVAYVGDTDDYFEFMLTLGFVMMFSVALPQMAAIALLCNLAKLKLFAYRMCATTQRPLPNAQEGIGAWMGIMTVFATFGVIVNSGLIIFVMHPIRNYELQTKLVLFIIVEHGMLTLFNGVTFAIPPKDLVQEVIEEKNAEFYDFVLGETLHSVEVEEEKPVSLSLRNPVNSKAQLDVVTA